MTLNMIVTAAGAHGSDPGTNILADNWMEESKYLRRLKRVAVVGSASDMDIKATFKYGNRTVAEILNHYDGAANSKGYANNMVNISSKEVCSPSEELSCWLSGTSDTNSVLTVIEVEEIAPPRRRRFRRGRRGFRRFRGRRRFGRRRY